jgi:hypothetical protein
MRTNGNVVRTEEDICLACGKGLEFCRCYREKDPESYDTLERGFGSKSALADVSAILKKHYLPAIQAQLNNSMILLEHLDHSDDFKDLGEDPAIGGPNCPADIVGDKNIREFRRRRYSPKPEQDEQPWRVWTGDGT